MFMIQINQIKIPIEEIRFKKDDYEKESIIREKELTCIKKRVIRQLRISSDDIKELHILKKSLEALLGLFGECKIKFYVRRRKNTQKK